MLSRSQAFAAAFSAKKALLNVNAAVNAERTFTFIPSMLLKTGPLFFIRVGSGAWRLPISGSSWVTGEWTRRGERERAEPRPRASDSLQLKGRSKHRRDA